jgi:dephospho-CoA kinase
MKPNRPYIIGLTGGIASGKSNLTKALRTAGAPVFDADEISHALTAADGAALPAIRAEFGSGVFLDGVLDRHALADIVFSDAAARSRLENIIHPLVIARIKAMTAVSESPAVIWDVPLLYESGMDAECDEIWCAYAPQKEQAARIMRRYGISRAKAMQRIKSQMPARTKAGRADHMIRTMGTKEESAQKVLALWADALRRLSLA